MWDFHVKHGSTVASVAFCCIFMGIQRLKIQQNMLQTLVAIKLVVRSPCVRYVQRKNKNTLVFKGI